MKRFRVLNFDFDTRVHTLTMKIHDDWEDSVKKLHLQNKASTEETLVQSFGAIAQKVKTQNFIDLGDKPLSIFAFHNRFFEQIRTSFIMGAYYPALTATCALGERILNHLLILLRDDYRNTREYKTIYRKDSFDDWDTPINTLQSWGVLLPVVTEAFRKLKVLRQSAIHFNPEVDTNDRPLALESILCMREIIRNQFSGFGTQPWFITDIPGEIYIKKSWENIPFIQKIYLPNCLAVGPKHEIVALMPRVVVNDQFEYDDREVTDEEFRTLRMAMKGA